MSASVRLSSFELAERIGVGGMGAVYRAEHAETGQQVAVKVLLAEVARRSDKRRDFRREVQALAKLHHPAIASVLDYGAVDGDTAAHGPDSFVEGAPWFAMEYVDGRPMPKGSRNWRWETLRAVLLTMLDGLAHAHARSIVHRDLKPENILLEDAARETSDPVVKLVDFGVARIFDPDVGDPEDRSQRITGTPKYMAPEQIRGAWRDQGPWTDLYALGCVVWRIVCDSPPVDGETTEDVLEGHFRDDPSEFRPQMPVPEGLEGWLRGLLHREIGGRTGHAADAARQLRNLDKPAASESSTRGTRDSMIEATAHQPTLQCAETVADSTIDSNVEPTNTDLSASGDQDTADWDGPDPEASDGSGVSREHEVDLPPIAEDWRRGAPDRKAAVVPQAGLELFALREVPVVDRDSERDRLWDALRRVQRDGAPEFVSLQAGAGAGKSRLAEWLCRRAREIGAANVLRATHSVSSAPDAGLRNMIRSEFRTGGLTRDEVFERLLRQLPALRNGDDMRVADARALTELLRPTDDDAPSVDGPRYRFSSPEHKHGLVRRLFERLSTERPLVVWLDDLQWGRQAVGVLEELFGTADPLPVLAVATVRSDLLAEDVQLEERLEELHERAAGDRITLPPLGPVDHRELIDSLLHLDDALAEALAERTEGNPLFTTQLLRELVEGGRLVAGPDGYTIPEGESLEPPEDVHDLWIRRLGRLIADLGGDAEATWRAVEWAATLGREVDEEEWREVCHRLEVDDPDLLQDALIQRGLAERTSQGWTFTHGMLVDSLQRRARDEGRMQTHHRRSAELLEDLYPNQPDQTAGRRADHWIGAGEEERALEPLLREAKRLEEREQFDEERERALDRRGELIDALNLPEDDPRRLENEIELAWYDMFLGSDSEVVLARLDELRRRAERAGCARLVARAWVCIARCRGQAGESEAVVEAAREATRWAERTDDLTVLYEATSELGWAEYVLGNLDVAEERFLEAQSYAEKTGDHYRAVDSKYGLAWAAVSRGNDERASSLFEEIVEECRAAGYRGVEANCQNGLGEVARFQGNVEEARRRYREYEDRQRELNRPGDIAIASQNRAQVELLAGEFDTALALLERAEQWLESLSRKKQWVHLLRSVRLTHAAGTGDWSRFDELFSHYTDGWPEDARLVKDHPWILEIAGDYAREAGEAERARRVWALARDLWEQLGDDEAAAEVMDKLEGVR